MENSMNLGYKYDEYNQWGGKIRLSVSIDSHTHWIITGASGSGKSNATLWLVSQYMRSVPCKISICDFKGGSEWNFLQDYPRYYNQKNCIEGIREYYEEFKQSKDTDKIYHLLIIDEYPALVSYLNTQDKLNKTKVCLEIQSMIFEILAMGRSMKYGIWIVSQRPDANLFANGSRDNFMVSIALGNISKEHKNMLFAGYDVPERNIYGAGEGIACIDGIGVVEVKYPLLKDIEIWRYQIFRLLMEEYME